MKSLILIFALLAFSISTATAQSSSSSHKQGPAVQVADTPKTIGETLRINSKRLSEQRDLHIYLPASYSNSRHRYPVIYTLDGEVTGLVTANAVHFMTSYSGIPQMPEALVVAVTNVNRNRDMPPPQDFNKGGQENFLVFLTDEVIPAIEQRYRTQPLRILLGHSQGGLFAVYALTARPKAFQWYIAIDAPLAGFQDVKLLTEKVRTLITNSPDYRGRLIAVENLYGWKKEWPSLIGAAPKGFYGERVEISGETHESMAYKGIYEGLKRLFHDYTPNTITHNRGIQTLAVLEARYKTLQPAYGYKVEIPKQLLLESAARNTAMQYGAEAVELIKHAVQLYGESPRTKRLLAEAEEAVKKGPDPRIAEWANLPPPDIEKMKPFLGTWERLEKGAHWFMTFEVKDGVVHAHNSITTPSGELARLEVQFVKVINSETMQWGLRNGLGGGTILHTGKLVNENTLEGMIEPVGIQHAPPPHPFSYKRMRK